MKYNLGSGLDIRFGYCNVDKKFPDILKAFFSEDFIKETDIKNIKLKNPEEVLLFHILEHFDDPFNLIMKIYKKQKIGDKVKIKLPTFDVDILHKNFIYNHDFINPLIMDNISLEWNKYYKVNRIKYQKFSFKRIMQKIYNIIMMILFKEVYIELEKIN